MYDVGVDPAKPYIDHFWAALERMNMAQRSQFIQFVYAKSRLPSSPEDFLMPFKISGPPPGGARDDPDSHLPGAKTCFFEINLPEYSSAEVCYQKLVYAMEHCTTMEDYATHSGAGFSGL